MNQDLENLLVHLSDNIERLLLANLDRKGLWYFYYRDFQKDLDTKESRKIYQQIYHLQRFGYIDKKGITIKGFTELFKTKGKSAKVNKWDNKWRVVIFDIPEKNKKMRDYFRNILLELGYQRLQNSVWIGPYDNFHSIQEIVKYNKIAEFVVLLVVDKISNELLFKKKFKL